MTEAQKELKLSGYNIKNQNCGRDKNGAFHCECGQCKTLLSETKQNHSPVTDLIQRITAEESTCDMLEDKL